MRAFVGIDIPDPVAARLQAVQAQLPMGRIVPRENLHLTLCFLGDIRDDALEAVHEGLSALRAPAVEVALFGLDWIGGAVPRGVVAGGRAQEELAGLQRGVVAACRRAGVAVERRRFVPHVTLARLGKTPASAALNACVLQHKLADFGGFQARGFSLYQSQLRSDGAVYTPLASYALVGDF